MTAVRRCGCKKMMCWKLGDGRTDRPTFDVRIRLAVSSEAPSDGENAKERQDLEILGLRY